MKKLRYIAIVLVGALLFSCEVDYLADPNQPEVAPTYGLMNRVQKRLMDDTRDEWFSGRMSLLWVQYWNQVNYTEEDRYEFRETVNDGGWQDLYLNAQDLVDLITFNTDEATKGSMEQFGPNENQIAAARIMLTFIYLQATEVWGDVPYYSYGSDNASFQANSVKLNGNATPNYAKQQDIYVDMLNELKEAAAQIITTEKMIDGDNFFGGSATQAMQWKMFANSLRLRIANRIKGVYPAASTHISEALSSGILGSNADNVGVTYENNAVNGAPMYRAFVVNARTDFAPSMQFVELLQGKRSNFGADPRLDIFVADNQQGFKVGIPLCDKNATVAGFNYESKPGDKVLAADATEIYIEYSEMCFIQSELNGWDQTWYEAGVRASMEKWGVAEDDIAAFIAALPAASEENVMMQKYIALYMQPYEAWSELRRTGYPNTLVQPNDTYDYTWPYINDAKEQRDSTVSFTYFVQDLTKVPSRVNYVLNEQSVNAESYEAAVQSIGSDEMTTKMWWEK